MSLVAHDELRAFARQNPNATQGLDPKRLRAWIDGADSPEVETHVLAFRLDHEPRHARERGRFIETPTAARLLSTLAYAQAYGTLVIVSGGPGLGKTFAIDHFAARARHVWPVTCSPMVSGLVPALEEIAGAIGSSTGGGARVLARAICQKVTTTGGRGLLVLDEAQHLTIGAVEAVRAIHDATGLGVAFVGNETVVKFGAKANAAHFAQLTSRVGMKFALARPSAADVAMIAAESGIRDAGSLELLVALSATPGGLRSVSQVVRLAARSGGAGREIIERAIANLTSQEAS